MVLVFIIQRRTEVPTGFVAGLFFAIAAIVMAHQAFNSYREGFMYCGVTERVYRERNPMMFKIWLVIQMSFVLFLAAVSIYAFLA